MAVYKPRRMVGFGGWMVPSINRLSAEAQRFFALIHPVAASITTRHVEKRSRPLRARLGRDRGALPRGLVELAAVPPHGVQDSRELARQRHGGEVFTAAHGDAQGPVAQGPSSRAWAKTGYGRSSRPNVRRRIQSSRVDQRRAPTGTGSRRAMASERPSRRVDARVSARRGSCSGSPRSRTERSPLACGRAKPVAASDVLRARRRPHHRCRRRRRGLRLEHGGDQDEHPLPRARRLGEDRRLPRRAERLGSAPIRRLRVLAERPRPA